MQLAHADTENEVVALLREAGYWEDDGAGPDPNVWRPYGDNESNFTTVGNQQASPEAALVEKIVNSIDASLMRECLRSGIDPESDAAPQDTKTAVESFFGVKDGNLASLTPRERSQLASNIQIVATGTATKPCYSVIDLGEGQTPSRMPDTLMSLGKGNKIRIPFVQGRFNVGSSGALQFCSQTHNLQLVISRRDPQLTDHTNPSDAHWSFTILRRIEPRGNFRNSSFWYLAPQSELLHFAADTLPLLPGPHPKAWHEPMGHGTVVKLYEYQLAGKLKTNILFDLNYRLAILLPTLALPVRLVERRTNYSGHSMETTLAGLSVRLDEDRSSNLEDGFPSSARIHVSGQDAVLQLYVFKPGKKDNYASREGIVFTIQGQAHGWIDRQFFSRQSVGMSYLQNSILVLADCSSFGPRTREDLFMNSRDRLRDGDLKKIIETRVTELLSGHEGLRQLRERRRQEDLAGRIGNSRPLADVLSDVIRQSPVLTQLLLRGGRLSNPFELADAARGTAFEGKTYPTFFRSAKEHTTARPKRAPCNHRFRVAFETDAENSYFDRDSDPGIAALTLVGHGSVDDFSLNLWNGKANLTVSLPEECASLVGEQLTYRLEVLDSTQVTPFESQFVVLVESAVQYESGGGGNRVDPPGDPGNGRVDAARLALPQVSEVTRDMWANHEMTRESALRVKHSPEAGYDFYVNVDNIHLLTEQKSRQEIEPEVLRSQYKFGLVLVALALLQEDGSSSTDGDSEGRTPDEVGSMCDLLSPFLLPMLSTLGHLEDGTGD
jgi:hypothetical protein